MKVTLSIAALLSALTEINADSAGYMDTCFDQESCLRVTVTEIESECESGSCEYEVCWRQISGGIGECQKWGDVVHLGDMHRYRDTESDYFNPKTGGCLNEVNAAGKGYWDEDCADPENVYSSGVAYQSFFEDVCQVVSPGHTAHLLIYDGESCSVDHYGKGLTAQRPDNNLGITAYCSPSTQNEGMSNPGGQTFFPSPDDPNAGGTCSTKPEGEECVWSITVPSDCSREETHCADQTGENQNADTLCADTTNKKLLEYYENDNNAAPPKPAIHDIALHDDGTVSFRVMNPFGAEFHDLYAVYPKPGDYANWNQACDKEQAASECTSDVVLTAKCLHEDQAFTLVTVFVAGYTDTSAAAALINTNHAGNSIFSCCPTDNEPLNQIQSSHVSAFTYLIHCGCGHGQGQADRLLRTEHYVDEARTQEITEAFHKGELFNDNHQLKELYGLN